MSHRSRFYVAQKSRKSQKDYIYVPIDFMSHRNHGNHRNVDLWSMKSAEEGQVIAQPVPKALSVISMNFCVTKKEN